MLELPLNILIGNCISFIAGIFLLISCCVNDTKKAYKYQFLEAFTLTISSVFFMSWTGVTTMAIAAIRNAMVYKDKLTLNWTVFFVILSVILGILVNTMGIIGFLPIIAIVQITICNYYLKKIKSIKISFIVNLLFYIVYFIAIYDFTSAVIQIITATIGLISLIKLIRTDGF
ncbi:YgjV family protein [Methanobrevibacter sp.]|uniref:YgjV family protein n=1 Tax=Methanobrevibacter sp. TaxID=66852 RepID=UPI0038688B57